MAKILIADDEEVARLTLAEILRLEGYDINSVSSGEAAVEALRFEPYDVMILDLKMAGMGGMEVLQTVVDTLPSLIVIVLTAYGSIDTAIQAIRYRVHDYLLKPVSPDQVLESIEKALALKVSAQMSIAENANLDRTYSPLPGGVVLCLDKRQIVWDQGSLSLKPTEARLLKNPV